jgi:hypothetical protein
MVPTWEHATAESQFPYGMRDAATTYASSASNDVAAYEDLPDHHLLAVRNLVATTTTSRTMALPASCPSRPRTGMWSGTFPVCQTQ